VTNEDVLKKVNESKNMLNVIRQWKRKWIGHALRHDEFLQEIFERRMKGRPTRGRKKRIRRFGGWEGLCFSEEGD